MIGQTVWLQDDNVRVYHASGGGPVYRSSFKPFKIVGENRASWLLSPGEWKVDKKTRMLRPQTSAGFFGMCRRVFWTPEDVDDACFLRENKHVVARMVENCTSAKTLRAIMARIEDDRVVLE